MKMGLMFSDRSRFSKFSIILRRASVGLLNLLHIARKNREDHNEISGSLRRYKFIAITF